MLPCKDIMSVNGICVFHCGANSKIIYIYIWRSGKLVESYSAQTRFTFELSIGK